MVVKNLAFAFKRVGNYLKHKNILELALSFKERAHGPEHINVAVTLFDLGCAFGQLGDYQKANVECRMSNVECRMWSENALNPVKSPFSAYLM